MTADAETPNETAKENPDETEGAPLGNAAGANAAMEGDKFQVLAQYVKDLSFEAPNTPQIFHAIQSKQPDIKVSVDVRAQKLQDQAYEVVLQINAECTAEDKNAFLLEFVYGALVRIDMADEALRPALLIETPRHMFPFARNIVADVTRDGGFPPLMLAPMDFVSFYENRQTGGEGAAAQPAPPEAASKETSA